MNIIDGKTIGCWFDKLPKLRRPPRLLVLHYTAGENPAEVTFRTLRRRGLSIHFVVDAPRVVQMADLDRKCAHAADVNGYSIGVEIRNRGAPPPLKGHPRKSYRDRARGRERSFLHFTEEETDLVCELADHITMLTRIPRMLPLEVRDRGAVFAVPQRLTEDEYPLPGARVLRDPMPPSLLRSHQGACGHCHVPSLKRKVDPGPILLDDLARHWSLIR